MRERTPNHRSREPNPQPAPAQAPASESNAGPQGDAGAQALAVPRGVGRGKASPSCKHTPLASESSGSRIRVRRQNRSQRLAAEWLEAPSCLPSPSRGSADSPHAEEQPRHRLPGPLLSQGSMGIRRAVNLISKGCALPSAELSPLAGALGAQQSQGTSFQDLPSLSPPRSHFASPSTCPESLLPADSLGGLG